jgi:hypothetical protein
MGCDQNVTFPPADGGQLRPQTAKRRREELEPLPIAPGWPHRFEQVTMLGTTGPLNSAIWQAHSWNASLENHAIAVNQVIKLIASDVDRTDNPAGK